MDGENMMMDMEQTPTGYLITDSTKIEQRPDGTYVLDGIYHVAETPEFADKLKEIMELVAANPERVIKLPEPTEAELLSQARLAKLGELADAFDTACQTATVKSSLGFEADADDVAYRNVQGLLITMENTGVESVAFCAADNSFHEVNQKELEALQQEIIAHGQSLYASKWAMRTAIESARTLAELEAIAIRF